MKMLRPKNINRLCVALALIAPLVYLFGTQFAALAGSHGEQVLNEPVYVEEFVSTDDFSYYSTYEVTFDVRTFVHDMPVSFNFNFDFVLSGYHCTNLRAFLYGTDNYVQAWNGATQVFSYRYIPATDSYVATLASPWVFDAPYEFSSLGIPLSYLSLKVALSVPTEYVYDNNSAYTEYLFGNMFGSRNFLTKIGENAIGSSPLGFAPFGAFLGFIDSNMLHLGNTPLGLMGYGYVYWCAHVLLFDLVVYFMVFFIRFIKSIVDRWEVR